MDLFDKVAGARDLFDVVAAKRQGQKVPGMEQLGGYAPLPPDTRRLPVGLRPENQNPEWDTGATFGGTFAKVAASPLTSIMQVAPGIIDWWNRGGRNAGPSGGFLSDEPVTQAYGNLVTAGVVGRGMEPNPAPKPFSTEVTGRPLSRGAKVAKGTAGAATGAYKSLRTGRAAMPGIFGGLVGKGLEHATGVPGLGYYGSVLGAAPEIIRGMAEGWREATTPKVTVDPHINKAAATKYNAQQLDPYTYPPARDINAGPREVQLPIDKWQQTFDEASQMYREIHPDWTPEEVASWAKGAANDEYGPQPSAPAPKSTPLQQGVGAGRMEYEASPVKGPRPAAKPKPAPKPTKAQIAHEVEASQSGYGVRDPWLSPQLVRPTLPEPPPVQQGVGAGSMELGGPEPPPIKPKPLTAAEVQAKMEAAFPPPVRPTLTPPPVLPEPPVQQGVGAGSMEYGGAPVADVVTKPTPLTKAEIQSNVQAAYGKPQAPNLFNPPPAPYEPTAAEAGRGVGAGNAGMEFDAPVPRPVPAKGETAPAGLPKIAPTEAEIQAELDRLKGQQRPAREPIVPRDAAPGNAPSERIRLEETNPLAKPEQPPAGQAPGIPPMPPATAAEQARRTLAPGELAYKPLEHIPERYNEFLKEYGEHYIKAAFNKDTDIAFHLIKNKITPKAWESMSEAQKNGWIDSVNDFNKQMGKKGRGYDKLGQGGVRAREIGKADTFIHQMLKDILGQRLGEEGSALPGTRLR